MNEDEINLDLKWIETEEKLISMENGINREQMKDIKIKYIYINCDLSIDAVDLEKYNLDIDSNNETAQNVIGNNSNIDDVFQEGQNSKMKISNDTLLRIIEKRRIVGNIRYKLLKILLFNVNLEPDEIQKYNNNPNAFNSTFLKEISVVKDIIIEPSIFIFHEINTIYILFKEIDRPKTLKAAITNKLKPILKTGKENRRTKKKVKIDLESTVIISPSTL